ncbi:MAG: peptidoglycan-associated lipoprotein Pal [Acidobacteriota bacterium]
MKNLPIAVWGALLLLAIPFAFSCKARPSAPEAAPPPSVEMETEDVSEPSPPPAPRPERKPEVETISPALDAEDYNRQGVLQTIYFDFDRSNIKDEFKSQLRNNARWLKDHPEFQVIIEGHCDERGTNEYNLALGDRRAASTKQYLISLGVPSRQTRTIAYGEERPVDRGHNESAWSKNRRAAFRIVKP